MELYNLIIQGSADYSQSQNCDGESEKTLPNGINWRKAVPILVDKVQHVCRHLSTNELGQKIENREILLTLSTRDPFLYSYFENSSWKNGILYLQLSTWTMR